MIDSIAIAGVVGTAPKQGKTNQGVPFINFRVASNTRRFNDTTKKWEDVQTNWYSVAAYRYLAQNLGQSIKVGEHVVVAGRLRVNEWKSGEKSGVTVEIVADAVGHDLTWGTSAFTRSVTGSNSQADAPFMPDAVSGGAGGSNVWSAPEQPLDPARAEQDVEPASPQLVTG